ncbi:MAG: ABC transporter permease [Chitinophagaceae bacterium]|nr:ABC transporter permease [Chitinophagaceae bacterium]
MFRHHIKTAIRSLWKNKTFTAINLLGLVLGLSSVMVLSVMVYQFLSFDNVQRDKASMAYLKTKAKDGNEYTQTTYPLLYEALKTCPQIEAGTHMQTWYNPWLKYNEKEIQEDRCYFVDSGFFRVFSFPVKYGSVKDALNDKFSVVLSEEAAEKLFGKGDPTGKTIAADDTVQLTVKAVLKHISSNNSIRPGVLLTTALLSDLPGFKDNANWYNGFAENYLKLKQGADVNKLEAQLNHLVKLNYHPERKSDKIIVVPFQQLPAESMGSIGKAIISGSIGTAFFILLIIVVNLVNLNAGTMFTRAKEVAVKQMMGSGKRSIIMQFCIENALIVLVSLLLAFLFFYCLLIPQMNQMFGSQFGEMELNIAKDYPLLLIFLVTGFLIVIIAASYPAWHLTSLNVTDAIKGKLSKGNRKSISRNAFITLQFVLSILLIYTTVILNNQMKHMKSASLGFNKDDVAVVNLDLAFKDPKTAESNFDAILNTLRNDTRVKSVSTNAVVPTAYWNNFNTYYDVASNKEVNLRHVSADAGYFSTFEIPMADGRAFNNVPDSNERGNVIINKAAMKAFGWTTAIGKQLKQKSNDQVYTVVGLTEDFNYRGLTENIEPLLHWYGGKQSVNNNYLSVLISKGHSKDVMASIETAMKGIPARRAFSYELMIDKVDKQYAMMDHFLAMARYVAFLTIFIACMGMLGLITLFSRQRIKEIGVRKVLGAGTGSIVLLLSRNFLILVTIAAVIAAPLAFSVMNGWLQNFAYRITIHWWMFVVGALAALAIVCLTVSFQSIKAALANPVKSLRTE